MNIPNRHSFTHIHSHTRSAEHPVIANGEKPEEILIARLVADLMDWIDSAWIIGVDLSPKLRQTVKTHFSSNGELSHGSRAKEVHERV